MNLPRILTLLTCGVVLQCTAWLAAAEDFAKKAESTIIPKLELKEASPAVAFQAITKATGIPIAYTPGKSEQAVITLSLTQVPASEALRYVASLANLKFSFVKDGVLVVPDGPVAIGASGNAPPAPADYTHFVEPAPGGAPLPAGLPLITREWKISPAFSRNLRQAAPPRQGETDDLLLARFLKEKQVGFQRLMLSAASGRLMVTSVQPNLDKIEVLVRQVETGARSR